MAPKDVSGISESGNRDCSGGSLAELPFWLDGAGEMGRLIASFDWSGTPLGPLSGWPAYVRSAVSMILRSPVAMVLLCGSEGILIYNQAYAVIAGGRHPRILGARAVDAFPEIAAFNRHVLDTCLAGGVLSYKDQRLTLNRHGVAEDVWLDLGYSPVPDAAGRPAGVLAVVVETTERNLSDERLRIAQEAGRFGTFEWYPQTHRLIVSDTYREIYGLTPTEEVTDFKLLGMLPQEDRHLSGNARYGNQDNPLDYAEYRIRHGVTGEIRWIARRGNILQKGGGAAEPRYVGVAWDITEKKRAELQDAFLVALGERLRDAGDAASVIAAAAEMLARHLSVQRVGYGEIDSAGATATVDSEWCDDAMPSLVGRHAVEDFGKAIAAALRAGSTVRIDDVLHDARLSPADGYAGFARIGTRAAVTVPLIVDGRWVGVLYAHTSRPRHWDDRDEAVMYQVVARTWDALTRAQTEQRLRDSEENFRLLAQTLPNQVWVAAPDGEILWVNEQAYAYTGAASGELQREDWARIVHPDDAPSALAAWTGALANGTTYDISYRLRRSDGTYRWHIARALPHRAPGGEIIRWIGANTDIEAQRRALAELAELNATLEERVEARTRELRQTEEVLRQAQKMEAIGQLTGGIAHDFNNLLTGIIGSLELVRRRIAAGRTADIDRFMDAAIGSAQRAAALTHRLLAYARRQPLDSKPVAVDALVRDMDDLLRRTLGEQVRLRISAAPGCWHAMTDANQLESAILNLAINARDAMPEGGDLGIATENRSLGEAEAQALGGVDAGDYVSIAVADTGAGMTPDVIEKAFEPFFTTKPAGQGTGLGLSMVYGFARQSGGHVGIASTPGHGTTVTLLLPRAAAPAEPAATGSGEAPRGAGETVLIVEDVVAVRMLIVDVLQELGYRTLEAADAEEALPIIASPGAIDLLVSDVGLPGLNGRQIADYARQRRPGLKVLFITGYAQHAAGRSDFLESGMAMITKPFAVDALAAKVSEMMAGANAPHSAEAEPL